MSLGWSKYVYAIDKGVATRHPCVIALHAILLLCVVGAPNGVNDNELKNTIHWDYSTLFYTFMRTILKPLTTMCQEGEDGPS